MPVIEAVGFAYGQHGEKDSRSVRIEQAVADAITAAQSRGVTDPMEMRRIILAARDEAVARQE